MTRTFTAGLMLAVAVLASSCAQIQDFISPPTSTPIPRGIAVDPPQKMPAWTLTNQDGQPATLSDLTQGKWVMIYFGYTHCPDVCPLSMSDFKAYKKALGDAAGQVRFVMISVDGARDTPEVMKRYVKAFDEEFIGLTGSENDVRQIGLRYGVHFQKEQPQGTQAAYLVSHTSYSYLVDPEGRWRMVFPYRAPAEYVAQDIRSLIGQ